MDVFIKEDDSEVNLPSTSAEQNTTQFIVKAEPLIIIDEIINMDGNMEAENSKVDIPPTSDEQNTAPSTVKAEILDILDENDKTMLDPNMYLDRKSEKCLGVFELNFTNYEYVPGNDYLGISNSRVADTHGNQTETDKYDYSQEKDSMFLKNETYDLHDSNKEQSTMPLLNSTSSKTTSFCGASAANSNQGKKISVTGNKLVNQKSMYLNHGHDSQQMKIKMYVCDCEVIEDHEIKDMHKISSTFKNYSEADHTKTDFYECKDCNKIYSVVGRLRYHINDKYSVLYNMTKKGHKDCKCRGIKRYVCQVCDQLFINIEYLKRHNKSTHTKDRKYVCEICDKKFLSLVDLKNHIYSVHETVKKYECGECPLKYPSLFRIREHINRVHIRLKDYVCEECGKTFPGKNNLISHKNVHSELKYTCQECGKMYSTMSYLKNHISVVHEGIKMYNKNAVCYECNKVFYSASHRKRHVDTVHLGIKKYKCPTCNRTFTQLSNMKIHISGVHYGIKKYECGVCLRTFIHSRDLKIHIHRAHIEVKDCVS